MSVTLTAAGIARDEERMLPGCLRSIAFADERLVMVAAQTVDRIIDVFPPYQQEQIRVMLASTLKGVVSQVLLPRADGQGRVAAREILIVTPAISALIREGKTHQIYSAIQTGGTYGMSTMEKSLAELHEAGLITDEDALSKANHPQELRTMITLRQQFTLQ